MVKARVKIKPRKGDWAFGGSTFRQESQGGSPEKVAFGQSWTPYTPKDSSAPKTPRSLSPGSSSPPELHSWMPPGQLLWDVLGHQEPHTLISSTKLLPPLWFPILVHSMTISSLTQARNSRPPFPSFSLSTPIHRYPIRYHPGPHFPPCHSAGPQCLLLILFQETPNSLSASSLALPHSLWHYQRNDLSKAQVRSAFKRSICLPD